MRLLGIHESLEEIVAKLREVSGRPVYVFRTSARTFHGATLLDASDSECSIGIAYDDGVDHLTMDRETQQALSRAESARHREWFKSVFMHAGDLQQWDVGPDLPTSDYLPDELLPYVKISNRVRPRKEKVKVVRFMRCEYIMNPNLEQHVWTKSKPLSVEGNNSYSGILPPGRYSGKEWVNAERHNRYLIVDKDPGDCIKCHGLSGKRKHFGHITFGPAPYPTGLICGDCAKGAFEEILSMLVERSRTWHQVNDDAWMSNDGEQVGRVWNSTGTLSWSPVYHIMSAYPVMITETTPRLFDTAEEAMKFLDGQ